MNFYSHHIGDFNNATRHLTRMERSIYRDLLELYYDTEKPLTTDMDRLARRCLVADDERGALREIISEFFELQDDGYHNKRADREIAAYQRMGEGGKRGAEKRWGKGGDSHPIATPLPPVSKANANHEPVTINQEPFVAPKALRATRLPKDFEPTPEPEAEAGIDRRLELAKFHDFWAAKGGKDGAKLDWQATWRNWARNARRAGPSPPGATVPSRPGRDPELERIDRDRAKAVPIPANIRAQLAGLTKLGVH